MIIAGIGLSQGIIGQNLFGVSILMIVITTLIAPILLIPLFRTGGAGVRGGEETLDADARSGAHPVAHADDSADDN